MVQFCKYIVIKSYTWNGEFCGIKITPQSGLKIAIVKPTH